MIGTAAEVASLGSARSTTAEARLSERLGHGIDAAIVLRAVLGQMTRLAALVARLGRTRALGALLRAVARDVTALTALRSSDISAAVRTNVVAGLGRTRRRSGSLDGLARAIAGQMTSFTALS